MNISTYYCLDYMTRPTQFGDEPHFLTNGQGLEIIIQCLGMVTLIVIGRTDVVVGSGDIGMIGAKNALTDVKCLLADR